jgi:hypothetical protein
MARIDVTELTVCESLVRRLRTQLKLTDRQCFWVLDPLAVELPPGGDYYVTVAPGDSSFPPEEQQPGNITEEWTVDVTIYSRMRLDSTNEDTKLLGDESRGLYSLKRKVLVAVVHEDLEDEDGDVFLRQILHVTNCTRPNYDKEKAVGWLTLTLGVSFDWDLT